MATVTELCDKNSLLGESRTIETGASCQGEDFLEFGTCGCKTKTPFQAVFRPRSRLNGCCAVDCARGGLGAMVTPVPSVLLLRGRSMPSLGQGCQGTASRHQRGPQHLVFKAERHAAVPMVLLRTLANMACSRGRGPANRRAGMIVLPDSAVSRKRKEPSRFHSAGHTPPQKHHERRVAPTPVKLTVSAEPEVGGIRSLISH